MMSRYDHEKGKISMLSYSCQSAKAIGCTVPGGQQVGFIDYNRRHPQRWWACHCDSGEYYSNGYCKGHFRVVKQ